MVNFGRRIGLHEDTVSSDVPLTPPCFPSRTPTDFQVILQLLLTPVVLKHRITLDVFRHGETLNNQLGLITGASDVPLSPRGQQQAEWLGHQLDQHYDLAFSSSLKRARETLALAMKAGKVMVEGIFADSRLDERSLGVLEGQPARPLGPYARGEFQFAPAQGDSYETVTLRLLSFLLDLATYSMHHNIQKVAISTHMGCLRILTGILEKERDPVKVLARKFNNASIMRLPWTDITYPIFLRKQ